MTVYILLQLDELSSCGRYDQVGLVKNQLFTTQLVTVDIQIILISKWLQYNIYKYKECKIHFTNTDACKRKQTKI